jgi:uncharacterized OsmC-like protein
MASAIMEFTVSSEQVRDYEFAVKFGEPQAPLLMDGPPGLGRAAGPCPTQLLAAAVGNCLAMTLVPAGVPAHRPHLGLPQWVIAWR